MLDAFRSNGSSSLADWFAERFQLEYPAAQRFAHASSEHAFALMERVDESGPVTLVLKSRIDTTKLRRLWLFALGQKFMLLMNLMNVADTVLQTEWIEMFANQKARLLTLMTTEPVVAP